MTREDLIESIVESVSRHKFKARDTLTNFMGYSGTSPFMPRGERYDLIAKNYPEGHPRKKVLQSFADSRAVSKARAKARQG